MSQLANQAVDKAVIYYTRILELKVFPLHDVCEGHCSCPDGPSCDRPGKHPRIKAWQREASTNPRKIERWWSRWPHANIGVPTGEINNLIVIDVDTRDEGFTAFRVHLEHRLPLTYSPITGGQGKHYWFRLPDSLDYALTNRNNFPAGIDVRGNGGYILVAPSVTNKGPYPWPELGQLTDLSEVPTLPRDVCDDYLRPTPGECDLVPAESVRAYERLSTGERSRVDRYVKVALKADLTALKALELDHRSDWDNSTFRLACKILELAKAPWSSLTFAHAQRAIREAAPSPDGQGWTRERVARKIESAMKRVNSSDLVRPFPEKQPTTPDNEPETDGWDKPEPRFRFTSASAYKPKAVEWIWERRISKGSIALLAGREDVGKSFVSLTLAADITHGAVEGCWQGKPKNVLYVATEDSWSHTIVPRLMAANADLNKVYNLELTDEETDVELSIVLQRDIKHLEEYITAENVGLIILDPIISTLGDANTYKATEVRAALLEVGKVAERTGCAILGVIHFNKTNNTDVLNAISESKAFTQVARSVIVAVKDSEDENRRLLSVQKSNLGQKPRTLIYEIRNTVVANKINIGKLYWLGETDQSAEEAHQQRIMGTTDVGQEDCAYYVKQTLLTWKGQVESNVVFDQGNKEGWSKDQLKRVKSKLRVNSKRMGDTWFWCVDDAKMDEWRNELMM